MKLTAEMIEGFSGVYLSPRYDQPQPTPDFHREGWSIYCSDVLAAGLAAPRNHAKSTSFTHDFTLANVCFRAARYVIIVGSSEEMAVEHLGDIANELRENEELIREFKISKFIQDQKTDIIVECVDGYQFRILARGAEQKIRGRKWQGGRPDLIIGDDLEDDEQVENKDRRKKFRRWFFRACKQALRDGGRIRVHGTILHVDSLLARLMRNKAWVTKRYKAHKSFSDFTDVLWPEKFPVARLKLIQQEFIEEGDSAGYSQEYLNDPRDDENSYLKDDQFIPMTKGESSDQTKFKLYYAGGDFAVSKADMANRTAFVVGGRDLDNVVHHVDFQAGRYSSNEWIDLMFQLQTQWKLDAFFVEDGVIWKSVWPMIRNEMQLRNIFINFIPILPTKDKATMARAYQKRMKAHACRYDVDHPNFPGFKSEVMDFTGITEAVLDDYLDAVAKMSKGLEDMPLVDQEDQEELTDAELEEARAASAARGASNNGRSSITGY